MSRQDEAGIQRDPGMGSELGWIEGVLDQYLFTSLEHVREATWWWMIEYNEERPHHALGDMTPLEARYKLPRNSSYELYA